MAKCINKTQLLGYAGDNPEVRYLPDGRAVANFSLATHIYVNDPKNPGEKNQITEWHRLVAFGRKAEIVRDFCKKGSRLHIECHHRTRSYQHKEYGLTIYVSEFIIQDVILLDGHLPEHERPKPPANTPEPPRMNLPDGLDPDALFDDDIPF